MQCVVKYGLAWATECPVWPNLVNGGQTEAGGGGRGGSFGRESQILKQHCQTRWMTGTAGQPWATWKGKWRPSACKCMHPCYPAYRKEAHADNITRETIPMATTATKKKINNSFINKVKPFEKTFLPFPIPFPSPLPFLVPHSLTHSRLLHHSSFPLPSPSPSLPSHASQILTHSLPSSHTPSPPLPSCSNTACASQLQHLDN